MGTKFGTAVVKEADSFQAGSLAAKEAMKKAGSEKVNLSLVFASSVYNYSEVIRGVKEATGNAPLIGASSAGEFNEEKASKESVGCAVISGDTHRFFLSRADNLKGNELKGMKKAAEKLPSKVEGYPFNSAILMMDGLTFNGDEVVLSAGEAMGPNVKIAGGAAGDDLKFESTRVFYNEESSADMAGMAMIASKAPVAIGVQHGHSPISPPLTITKTRGNTICEIDGKPALEVWKEYAREKAEKAGIDVDEFTEKTLTDFFVRFEAGIHIGTGYKIRFLGGTKKTDGPLVFPGAISEGMVIRVMESPKQDQIDSARKAAEIALQAAGNTEIAGAVVFDCACRNLILGDDFPKAVGEIKKTLNVPLIGFETYGEIAKEISQLSGFHQTTTVVLLIPA